MISAPETRSLPIPQWALDLAVLALVGIFFGFLGPFSSDRTDLPLRLAYWVTVMPAGGICIIASEAILRRALPPITGWPITITATALIAALPQTGLVLAAEYLIFGYNYSHLESWGSRLTGLSRLYGAVLLVMFAMVPLLRLVRSQGQRLAAGSTPMAEQEKDIAPPPMALSQRLSRALAGQQVLALQAEDHYVRVYTTRGNELILMRLGDAIAETAPLVGYRTHRSWWVASEAIETAQFRRGTGVIRLTSGLDVPLSRTYAPDLREAGLLN